MSTSDAVYILSVFTLYISYSLSFSGVVPMDSNNYKKKNASLTKDVKRLITQLEKQTKSFSTSKSVPLHHIADDNEVIQRLRDENKQLSEDLMRKSQSLVDALKALSMLNNTQSPISMGDANTFSIADVQKFILHHSENGDNGKIPTQRHRRSQSHQTLQIPMDIDRQSSTSSQQSRTHSESPPSVNASGALHDAQSAPAPRIVIGAKYGINDLPPSANRLKFDRLKDRFGSKMKQSLAKVQQNMVQHQIQRQRSLTALSIAEQQEMKLNELNAKNAIKESEKVLSLKTKQQLNVQCEELQGLANELSSTIEQKEVILDSLRFANTYLGKRVIALEKLMKMQPGQEITNQDELIREAIHSAELTEAEEEEDQHEAKGDESGNESNDNANEAEDAEREQSAKNGDHEELKEDIVGKEENVIITERRQSVADIVQKFESPSPDAERSGNEEEYDAASPLALETNAHIDVENGDENEEMPKDKPSNADDVEDVSVDKNDQEQTTQIIIESPDDH